MKYFFEVFGPNNIAEKIGSLSLTVFVQDLATKFAQFSIFPREFCKDLRKFACFVSFGCK